MRTATKAITAKQHTHGTTPSAHDVLPVSEDQPTYIVQNIAIAQIVIPEGRREPKEVDTLAESIHTIGLLHPIRNKKQLSDSPLPEGPCSLLLLHIGHMPFRSPYTQWYQYDHS